MVTALAALAAGAMAEDVVPSGNIVGYAKLKLEYGTAFNGAVFKDIGTTVLDIKTIATDSPMFTTSLAWWNASNAVFEAAVWIGEWVDGETEDPVNKKFFVGEGFQFQGAAGSNVVLKGEIYTSQPDVDYIKLPIQNSVEFFVNPMPVALDIKTITTDSAMFTTSLAWWNASRSIFEAAVWVGEWVDGETEDPVDKEFAVGEGFQFQGQTGKELVFPNPLYTP